MTNRGNLAEASLLETPFSGTSGLHGASALHGAPGSPAPEGGARPMRSTTLRCLIARAMTVALLLAGPGVAAQIEAPVQQLSRFTEDEANIVLDGFVDEAVWQQVPVVDNMRVVDPDTMAEAPYETRVRVFHSERGIYVSAVNHQPPGTLVARMTSRDTRLDRDGFVVALDSSGEGLYGYFLRMNLGGSMSDATLLPERQMNMQWDGAWSGATQELEEGWSVECFIPWSMLALPRAAGDTRQIGLYFERQVGHLGGETWSNPALPRTVNEYLSAFEKYELRDIEPRRQLTFYPFASSVHDSIADETGYKAGAEMFWRPTTNSLLSATLNPDFGNVESDDVVVNLSAFETFFPEKRTFFLEGQDIFNATQRAGGNRRGFSGPLTLLNTRRIGAAPHFPAIPDDVEVVATDLSAPSDLLGAVKFTGSAGNWQYGTLFASEDDTTIEGRLEDGTPVGIHATGRDFGVARLLYEDTSDGGGRRSLGWMGTRLSHPQLEATAGAIDWGYFSSDNRWIIDGQAMYSDVHGTSGFGVFNDVSFRPRRGVNHSLRATFLDDELDLNDLGFSQRNDSANLDYTYFRIESDLPGLRSRTTGVFIVNQWNTRGQPVRLGAVFNRGYTFPDSNRVSYSLRWLPRRIDDRLGGGSGDFAIPQRFGLNLEYETDQAKSLAWGLEVSLGQDDLGPARNTIWGGLSWRPIDRFSLDFAMEYEDREALLVHRGEGSYTSFEAHGLSQRIETSYFITARQQFRLSLQWRGIKAFEDMFWRVNPDSRELLRAVEKPNDTADDFIISRMTFQARYRWEIAPLSDLFVVYTRGGNLPRERFLSFQGMLEESWNTPVVDTLAVKLRYRLGS